MNAQTHIDDFAVLEPDSMIDAVHTCLAAREPCFIWGNPGIGKSDIVRQAAQQAFGQAVDLRYDLEKADVVVSLDSDFLTSGPGHIPYARAFGARRKVEGSDDLNRLYAIESTPTLTGTMADHRKAASTARRRSSTGPTSA